jgi:hypothetical protein
MASSSLHTDLRPLKVGDSEFTHVRVTKILPLPLVDPDVRIEIAESLGEGGSPCIRAKVLPLRDLWVQTELLARPPEVCGSDGGEETAT